MLSMVIMQLLYLVLKNFSLIWFLELITYLTKSMKAIKTIFNITLSLFFSLLAIDFMKIILIEIKTTMQW